MSLFSDISEQCLETFIKFCHKTDIMGNIVFQTIGAFNRLGRELELFSEFCGNASSKS